MKKRFLPLLILLVLLFTLTVVLASCTGTPDSSEPEATDSSAEESSAETSTTTTAKNTTTVPVSSSEAPVEADPWVSAVFGGGPFVTGYMETVNKIKDSGFNTYIIWSVHLDEKTGDLIINDVPVVRNGEFIGNKGVQMTWKRIRENCPNITRIELSIDAWGTGDFTKIKKFIEMDPAEGGGTGENSILYKNFKALIEASGAHAINYDDESCYDLKTGVEFGKMCEKLGVKVSLCPYTNQNYWVSLYKALGPELCDRIYLQCYAGGAGNKNNIKQWAEAFGTDVIPGYWCNNTESPSDSMSAATVKFNLSRNLEHVTGGFMWLFDQMKTLQAPNAVKDYGTAITEAGKDKVWD